MSHDNDQEECDHTEGVREGYIRNCPFCGWVNPEAKDGNLTYHVQKREGIKNAPR